MKFKVKPFDPSGNYDPGDLVQVPSGAWRVRSHRGEWLPVAAAPDYSLRGEKGEPGERGVDGADGRPGTDGAPGEGFRFRGAWKRRCVYHRNDVATLAGSSWLCVAESTNTKPGVTNSWEPLALRGEDGERGEPGRDGESFTSIKFRREIVQGPQLSMTAASDFTAGDAAFARADGLADLACADGEPQTLAIGVAIAPASEGYPVQVATSGLVTNANWSWSVPGATLYLSTTTPGGLTEVYPTEVGTFVVVMGVVVSPTQVSLNIAYKAYIGG